MPLSSKQVKYFELRKQSHKRPSISLQASIATHVSPSRNTFWNQGVLPSLFGSLQEDMASAKIIGDSEILPYNPLEFLSFRQTNLLRMRADPFTEAAAKTCTADDFWIAGKILRTSVQSVPKARKYAYGAWRFVPNCILRSKEFMQPNINSAPMAIYSATLSSTYRIHDAFKSTICSSKAVLSKQQSMISLTTAATLASRAKRKTIEEQADTFLSGNGIVQCCDVLNCVASPCEIQPVSASNPHSLRMGFSNASVPVSLVPAPVCTSRSALSTPGYSESITLRKVQMSLEPPAQSKQQSTTKNLQPAQAPPSVNPFDDLRFKRAISHSTTPSVPLATMALVNRLEKLSDDHGTSSNPSQSRQASALRSVVILSREHVRRRAHRGKNFGSRLAFHSTKPPFLHPSAGTKFQKWAPAAPATPCETLRVATAGPNPLQKKFSHLPGTANSVFTRRGRSQSWKSSPVSHQSKRLDASDSAHLKATASASSMIMSSGAAQH